MDIQLLEKKELNEMTLEELKKLKGELETTLTKENTCIEKLIVDEKVKKYISHAKIINKILELKPILDLELKKKQMLGCYHIWVKTYVNSYYDGHRYEKEIDYFRVVALEEPEAHINPILQRHLSINIKDEDDVKQQILITTHSTHIASYLELQNTVVLYKDGTEIKNHYLLDGFDEKKAADKKQ